MLVRASTTAISSAAACSLSLRISIVKASWAGAARRDRIAVLRASVNPNGSCRKHAPPSGCMTAVGAHGRKYGPAPGGERQAGEGRRERSYPEDTDAIEDALR